jgi:hypothetical protein
MATETMITGTGLGPLECRVSWRRDTSVGARGTLLGGPGAIRRCPRPDGYGCSSGQRGYPFAHRSVSHVDTEGSCGRSGSPEDTSTHSVRSSIDHDPCFSRKKIHGIVPARRTPLTKTSSSNTPPQGMKHSFRMAKGLIRTPYRPAPIDHVPIFESHGMARCVYPTSPQHSPVEAERL